MELADSNPRSARQRCAALIACAVTLAALLTAAAAAAATSPPRPRTAPPPSTTAYVTSLITRARALHLAEREEWLRLVHYRNATFGGYRSEADGPLFFLAEDGKTDPEAELEATLRGFFGPAPKTAKQKKEQHPVCRLPARFLWLKEQLDIDPGKLPVKSCPRFQKFVSELRARSVTLIFSSYYLNNPASAFGHTFLRIGRTRESTEEGVDLLDSGIDFSANVDTNNALLYAIKGLTGLFPGEFRRVPFSAKVREYNDYESRDIWEYELDFTPDEVARVVAHLWELGSTYFAYYYMSENCSYHVLGALEVANPRLRLLEGLGWPVIPADTVKALYRNPGLVRQVHYRPSNRTQFRQRLELLTGEERDAVGMLMHDARAPLPASLDTAERVRVLDAAIDLIDVRMARDLLKKRHEMDQEGAEQQQALLERRAEIAVESEEPRFPAPLEKMPHVGHDSVRLGMGSGARFADLELRAPEYYHTLSLRLALHDLADSAAGYPDSAQIEFFATEARYYVESPRLTLEELSLVRVRSLSPLTRFDRSMSFSIDAGMTRIRDSGCHDCPAGYLQIGGGVSLAPFGPALLVFALGEAQLGAPVDGGLLDTIRLGVGPVGGLRLRFADPVALLATGAFRYLPEQTPDYSYELGAQLRAAYFRNFALGVEGRLFPEAASIQGVSYLYF